ncbi:MAG: sulfite exporter TauE/SafE family protein [candidate division Zixibacteria bacterium]|nr:sulfite exporter TauE/SafE family protein [candidate division Zixibacteria bacterium]
MDWIVLLVVGLAIFCGFFVQTIIGFAASVIAVPIILFVCKLQDAVATMAILLFVFSFILVLKNYKEIDKNMLLEMGIGIILGIIVGVVVLRNANPIILKKGLGVFVVLYALYSLNKQKTIEIFKRLGLLFGFVGGIFSGLYTTGGPVYVTYITNKLSKASNLRATIIGVMGVSNLARLPILFANNLVPFHCIKIAIFVSPLFILSLYLGHIVYPKINECLFKRIVLAVLLISGLILIVK